MKFLHTMIRVNNLEESKKFYQEILGMKVNKEKDYPEGKFTLVFLGYEDKSKAPQVELTYNWDKNSYTHGDAFGHLAIGVKDIYKICEEAKKKGAIITREPGEMKYGGSIIAFIKDPNGYMIELIQT